MTPNWAYWKKFLSENKHVECALCLYWGWQFAFFWSGLFQKTPNSPDMGFLGNVWMMSLIPFALSVLLIIIASPLRHAITSSPGASYLMSGLLSISIFLLALQSAPISLMLPATLLTGLATGAYTVCFGRLLSRYRPKQVLTLTAVATSAGAACSLAVSSLDFLLACVAMAAIPFFIARFYARALASTSGPETSHEAKASAVGSYSRVTYLLFLVVTALMGVSIALVRYSLGADIYSPVNVCIFNCTVFMAGVLLCLSHLSSDGRPSAIFFAILGVAVSACGTLSLIIQNASFSFAIHTLSFTYFNGFFWMLATGFSLRTPDCTRAFALTQLTMQLGLIVGTVLGDATMPLESHGSYAALVAGYAVQLLSVVFLATFSSSRPCAPHGDELRATCASIGACYGLTKREAEILACLYQGMSRTDMSTQLDISNETVKTHVSHIYAKTGLHSRQELVDLMNKQAAANRLDILD